VGQTHFGPTLNALEKGLWGLGFIFYRSFGGSLQRGLSKEWARADSWAIGQIDASNGGSG